MKKPPSHLAFLPIVLLVAAACGSSAATPSDSGSPVASSTVLSASATPGDTATPSDTATPVASATATAASTPAGATRGPWVRGQTVKQYDLVAPGKGWVYTNRGVWQTIDDGATWANATPHGLIVSKIRGLGAFDANHALLAVVDVTPGTSKYYIWRTTNAGVTWAYTALPGIPNDVPATPCAPGDFCGGPGDPVAIFDNVNATTAFVYIDMRTGFDGLNTYLYETTNGGVTWTRREWVAPDPPTGSGSAYRVQFMTPNIGVAEFEDQIGSTITGWGHWVNRHLPTPDFSEPRINFLSETKWYGDLGIGYAPGSVIYHYTISTDQGHLWTNYTSSVPGVTGLTDAHVQFLGPLEWIGTELTATSSAIGASETIYTTDGGHHWAMEGHQPFNGSQAFFVDATHGWVGPNDYLGTGAPKLYSTRDGGRTWNLLTPA